MRSLANRPMAGASSSFWSARNRRSSASFAQVPAGADSVAPIDKKDINRGELDVLPGQEGEARDGDLVAVETLRAGRLRPALRQGARAARLARQRKGGEPDRHPRPRDPAMSSAPRPSPRPSARRPAHARGARGLARACRSSPSIRPTPRIMTTRSMPSPIPIPTIAAASSSSSPSPMSRPTSGRARALDREALERGNSVYFPDRVVPMLPERISNDLCSLRPHEDRPALAVRMVIGADGRKRSHSFHRIMMRSAAKLAYAQAQAAIDGAPGRDDGAAARAGSRAALCRLRSAEAGAGRARAARTRSARTQDPARRQRAPSIASSSPAAARRASPDRGIHDPRQCRGGRNAGRQASGR